MSILIKGAEMPKSCICCDACYSKCIGDNDYEWRCSYTDNYVAKNMISNAREKDCPLVPVPTPHGRLIDADAEAKKLGLDRAVKYGNKDAEQQYFSYSTMMMYEIRDIFDDAPTVVESEE